MFSVARPLAYLRPHLASKTKRKPHLHPLTLFDKSVSAVGIVYN